MNKQKYTYYKRIQGRYYGKLIVISYLKIIYDGNIYCIDLTRMKTSTMKTFGDLPMQLQRVNKKQFDVAMKKFKNYIKSKF